MREILFRGKCVDEREKTGEWIYGYYIHAESKYGDMDLIAIPSDNPEKAIRTLEVDPETVGQYTGLKDKNGTRIFYGDILNGPSDSYEEVEVIWNNASFVLKNFSGEEDYLGEYVSCLNNATVKCNIHDDAKQGEGKP